ncbi:MAG: von Willebrand factor type A domain-containing protein [Pseudomonadota bacterium]
MTPDLETLTAYALGELSLDERVAVARALEADPEARAIVEELQALAAIAEEALVEEPALSERQRSAILNRAEGRPRRRRWIWTTGAAAAAATVLLSLSVVTFRESSPVLPFIYSVDLGPSPARGPVVAPDVTPQDPGPSDAPAMRRRLQRQLEQKLQPSEMEWDGDGTSDGEYLELHKPDPSSAKRTVTNYEYSYSATRRSEQRPALDPDAGERLQALAYVDANDASARYDNRTTPEARGGGDDGRYWHVADPYAGGQTAPAGTESYTHAPDSTFQAVATAPLSTFAADVDTASYSNVRRYLEQGSLPPRDAVRIEELINAFDYAYPGPDDGEPFSASVEVAACPWAPAHRLARIGLQARRMDARDLPPSNLVLLVDTSGSMQSQSKLPLLKQALLAMVDTLRPEDRVAIVTYASGTAVALPSTPGSDQRAIRAAIEHLKAAGSTNGGAGISLAYAQAREHFVEGGSNRVLLATDGDFNVGLTDQGALVSLVQQQARGGIFLTVLGLGTGNLKDATLERIADEGRRPVRLPGQRRGGRACARAGASGHLRHRGQGREDPGGVQPNASPGLAPRGLREPGVGRPRLRRRRQGRR